MSWSANCQNDSGACRIENRQRFSGGQPSGPSERWCSTHNQRR